MMEDLVTDSAAIPEVRTSSHGGDEDQLDKPPIGNFQKPKMPQAMHLSGCSKIHIGPLYNCIDPASVRTPPPGAVSPLHSFGEARRRPSTVHVESLLSSQREIEVCDMDTVSTHLGEKWRQVGDLMNYSQGQIETIDAHPDCPRLGDKAYKLLTKWRDREDNFATVANLTRILMNAKAFDAVNKLTC